MKIKDNKYIGMRLRERRKELGLSQERLAEMLDVTYQQVQKYEKGINKLSPEKMQMASRALGVPVLYFFEGTDVKKETAVKETTVIYGHERLSPEEKILVRYFSTSVQNKF